MNLKTEIKKLIGKVVPVDLFEKLTEYAIWQKAEGFDLAGARRIHVPGKTWLELVEKGREQLWSEAIKYIGITDVIFLEFGVWKGESIKFFGNLIKSEKSKLYGFDSFEGLPEQWRGMKEGHFSTKGQIPRSDDKRIQFIKGWFQNTLPNYVDTIANESKDRAVLIHLDADLYSSTLFVLYTISQKIKQFYFIFDEFSGHELRALYNFIQASGSNVEFYRYIEYKGCPMTVFGKIRVTI